MKKKEKRDVPPGTPYENGLYERLKEPQYAIDYLNSILEEHDPDLLLLGLRDIAKAHGFKNVAESTGLNRESLYKALSKGKNPRIGTIMQILSMIGCRIRLEPKKKNKNLKKRLKRKAA